MPCLASPPGICLLPTLNYLHPLSYRYYMMTDYALFLQGSDRWGEGPCLVMGAPQHLPLLTAISYSICSQVIALLPHQPQGLGGQRKILE